MYVFLPSTPPVKLPSYKLSNTPQTTHTQDTRISQPIPIISFDLSVDYPLLSRGILYVCGNPWESLPLCFMGKPVNPMTGPNPG